MAADQPQLVFGDDGSAAADVVWLWINNHAWPGWRISVVTARPPAVVGPPLPPERSSLHPWEPPSPRRLLTGGEQTRVEHLMAEADPRLVLDSCKGAALTAIGPRGSGLLKHLRIGSTAEWLLSAHRPLTPVAIVRSARLTRHVLLAVDGSVHAQEAVRTLAGLPWIGTCRITAVSVQDGRTPSERALKETTEVLSAAGATVETRELDALRAGGTADVTPVLLDAISEERPDLVAMGTRGIGGIQRLVLGSTARAVAHLAPCSVLIARDTVIEPAE